VASIVADLNTSPSRLWIRVKDSKADPFHKGSSLHIGPLFLFCNGHPLSRVILQSLSVHDILSSIGIQGKFSSHRFHIGAATVVVRNGIPGDEMETLSIRQALPTYRSCSSHLQLLDDPSFRPTAGSAATVGPLHGLIAQPSCFVFSNG